MIQTTRSRLTRLIRQATGVQERHLKRVIVGLGLAILAVAAAFAVLYYRDRYVGVTTLGEFDQQVAHLEAQIRQDPTNVELRLGAAQAYYKVRRYAEAAAQAGEALTVEPDNQTALALRGLAYYQTGQADPARADFSRILELNRDNPTAKADQRLELVHYHLGMLDLKGERYAEAQAEFKAALEINRGDADAWYQLGQACQGAGDHPAAVAAYRQVVRFVPDYAEAYQGMARSYRALGEAPMADYAEAMDVFSRGDYGRAAAMLEALVEQHPQVIDAYLGAGLAYEKLGERDKALAALAHYVAERPDDIAGRQALGRIQQSTP